jgi:alpha-glucosidase
VTRLGGGALGGKRARASLLLLLGLPGQAFLYQGEELGLEEVNVPKKMRQDPEFMHSGGKKPGRDGCRVPLPWHKGRPNAGFSKAAPWLPMPAGWDRLAVDAQAGAADSMLVFYRHVLAMRRRLFRTLPIQMTWSRSRPGVLLYEHGRLTVAVNFLAQPVSVEIPGRLLIGSHPLVTARDGHLRLPANSGVWLDNTAL